MQPNLMEKAYVWLLAMLSMFLQSQARFVLFVHAILPFQVLLKVLSPIFQVPHHIFHSAQLKTINNNARLSKAMQQKKRQINSSTLIHLITLPHNHINLLSFILMFSYNALWDIKVQENGIFCLCL